MKKFLIFSLFLFGSSTSLKLMSQNANPTPCGEGWLCGSATAIVSIETSRIEGFTISADGGISVGSQYTNVQCCAASSNMNACSLSGESNSSLCFSSRVGDWFETVRFNREK